MMATQDVFKGEGLSDRERKNIDILNLIRKNGPIAKTEISRLTGLNIVTVSNYIDNFIEQKLICEKGLDISTGGRRPTLVELNSDMNYVVGVSVNRFDIRCVITNLRGNIISNAKVDVMLDNEQDVVGKILNVTEEFIEKSNVDKSKLSGIGLGILGTVDEKARIVKWRKSEGKEEVTIRVSFKEAFESRFGLSTIVDTNANMALFGEKWYVLSSSLQHLLYVYSSTSCGVIINGEIYHGVSGNGGILGLVGVDDAFDNDKNLIPGLELKQFYIEDFMVSKARKAWENNHMRDSKIFNIAKNKLDDITPDTILRALKQLDHLAIEITEEAGDLFGKKLAFLVNLLNPEIIVIGGDIEQAGSIFLDAVKKTVGNWCIDEVTNGLKIVPTQLGESAVLLGAAGSVVNRIFANA